MDVETLIEQERRRIGRALSEAAILREPLVHNRRDVEIDLEGDGLVVVPAGLYLRVEDVWETVEGTEGEGPIAEFVRVVVSDWMASLHVSARREAGRGFASAVGESTDAVARRVQEAVATKVQDLAGAIRDVLVGAYSPGEKTSGVAVLDPEASAKVGKLRTRYPVSKPDDGKE